MTAEWFLPKNLSKLEASLDALAQRYVDKMIEMGGECDFARDIAMQMPLNVILSILGLPESDYGRMLMLTQEMFGAADEDLRRGESVEDLIRGDPGLLRLLHGHHRGPPGEPDRRPRVRRGERHDRR